MSTVFVVSVGVTFDSLISHTNHCIYRKYHVRQDGAHFNMGNASNIKIRILCYTIVAYAITKCLHHNFRVHATWFLIEMFYIFIRK
ncbi:hypothetical protein AR158_c117R [Paramecium bursaria Chlorella virus AR158]|uniref:hypothetical protein n=1 Tax=Paramecium bursaria Chlorella virus AR158 TaxID=380598 RepID=UPI00015AA7DA|nr:hypothetical protein AR158_c117R [Paramecium bursaria Chlorella virus AR158]ABU43663.1 hypothetical protein AR158_c117R [Paramecium bursaria Chlorella virus AR158]